MTSIPWLFRAKPRYRLGQFLKALVIVGSADGTEGLRVSRHAVVGFWAAVTTVAGSVFVGGALWLAQGAHKGAGDAMGIGVLASLGAALIVLGLGTALACVVTCVVHLPVSSDEEGAAAAKEIGEAADPREKVRPKGVRPRWWPFGRRV